MATMNPAAAGGAPYTVPAEPSPGRSMLMAVGVHLGLLLFLGIGVSWQSAEPTAVEAEVWDMKTETAAAPPEPQPEPVRRPDPVPEPPKPVVEEPPPPKAPDIALEKIKEQKKKLLEKKLAEEKVREELKKEKEQELADKKAKEKLALAEQKKADQRYQENMKRMMGALGTSGNAAKSSAPRIDTGYIAALSAKIKSSTRYVGESDVPGNPRVEFKIEQMPTGEIISVRKTKSSGIAAFDDAVERGINKSSPLPKKKDGTVERSIELGWSIKEFD
jgi:colicin import membrane protein